MSVQNIKPSTRDLAHFVSPNAGTQNVLIQITPDFFNNPNHTTLLNNWEDKEIAGLVLSGDLQNYESHINTLTTTLSCSLLWNHNIHDKDQISLARSLQIDAILCKPFDSWDACQIHAQTMNLRLIPKAMTAKDIETFAKERFIYAPEELLAKCDQSCESWIISEASDSQTKLILKYHN